MLKKITGLLLAVAPLTLFAHVKWFAQEPATAVRPYQITDWPVVVGIILALLVIVLGLYLEKKISVPRGFISWAQKHAAKVLSLAGIGFGLAFIIFTLSGFIFAPNLEAVGATGAIMLIIQGLAGLMITLGLYDRIGGFLIMVLFMLGASEYGFVEMLDTLEMVGFALYIMIIGRPKWKLNESRHMQKITHKLRPFGYPLLRVGVGLNLLILGFSEKIFAPGLTHDFLSRYVWNFMEPLGMSDYWFAFAGGLVEALFGVFFILGLITRITTLVLAGFLVVTLVLLGPVELIGHLPHFSIALVLFVLGAGQRFVIYKHTKK
jgi:uncharacterized membrane protein YphA (DoxX/SURF4 family)